ncbi:MAG: carboxymuconolactone decarboxylase family protein, partial [Bacteroidota bacterium]
KMNGFNDDQILELRQGTASFDSKLNALARFARETTLQRGKPSRDVVDGLLSAGYTQENLVDAVVLIGDKIVTNFLHGVTEVPVDFPAAPELEPALA